MISMDEDRVGRMANSSYHRTKEINKMYHGEDRFGERRYRYGRGGFFFFPIVPLVAFFLLLTLLFSGGHHFWFFGLPLMFLFPMFLIGIGLMFLARGLAWGGHRHWEGHDSEWRKHKHAQFRAMYGLGDEGESSDQDYSDHDDVDSDIHYV